MRSKRKAISLQCICDVVVPVDHCGDREYEAEGSESGRSSSESELKLIHAAE